MPRKYLKMSIHGILDQVLEDTSGQVKGKRRYRQRHCVVKFEDYTDFE